MITVTDRVDTYATVNNSTEQAEQYRFLLALTMNATLVRHTLEIPHTHYFLKAMG